MVARPERALGGSPHQELDFDRAPMVLTWEITQACDLRCIHCRAEACTERDALELSTEEATGVIDRITTFEPSPPVLVFSGGDPLKRPDLVELVAYATGRGLRTAVTQASSPLLTRVMIQRLKLAGTARMALSLDGSTPASHDAFRGEPGSFATILRAATETEVGLPLQINSTVTKGTAGDLPAISDLVERLGAVMGEVFFLVPVGRGMLLEPLGAEQTEYLLEWLWVRQRTAPFRVITVQAPHYRRVALRHEKALGNRGVRVGSTGDGKGFLFISHTGEIFPSGFLPVSAGNVRSHDLVEAYRRSPLFLELRDPDALKGKCGLCEYRSLCGGARARAHALTGDFLAADPFCAYSPPGYQGSKVPVAAGQP